MKGKKEITEHDLQVLERHINTTKLRLIDMQNQFNKTMGKIKSSIVIVFSVSIIITLLGVYLT